MSTNLKCKQNPFSMSIIDGTKKYKKKTVLSRRLRQRITGTYVIAIKTHSLSLHLNSKQQTDISIFHLTNKIQYVMGNPYTNFIFLCVTPITRFSRNKDKAKYVRSLSVSRCS